MSVLCLIVQPTAIATLLSGSWGRLENEKYPMNCVKKSLFTKSRCNTRLFLIVRSVKKPTVSPPVLKWHRPFRRISTVRQLSDSAYPTNLRDIILEKFNIQNVDSLEGVSIIFDGRCRWNKDKTKKIITINDSERLFISLAD